MSVTVVLDGSGLRAWARQVPPSPALAVMEVIRSRGSGHVVVPSVVAVEALTGGPEDDVVSRALLAVHVETDLPVERTRTAALLRRGLTVSVADAIVAEAAIRHEADYLLTADPDDLLPLIRRGGGADAMVVAV